MGYTRRKMKTSRRVKRAKTKNTRKQKRNRTFRKSRRVNRGGSGKGKSRGIPESKMEDEEDIEELMADENSEETGMAKLINRFEDRQTAKEKSERDAIDREKEIKTDKKIEKNIKRGMYRTPLGKGLGEVIEVNQRKVLANTTNQQRFMDELDAEEVPGGKEGGPFFFGGKKKRTIKKK